MCTEIRHIFSLPFFIFCLFILCFYIFLLPDGAVLEVNHVDEGQPTEFWYAEVEYPTVEAARSWQPAAVGLADYLNDEVTDQPGQSMGAYWEQTRG